MKVTRRAVFLRGWARLRFLLYRALYDIDRMIRHR